ncbi:Tripeptidyl-peptidase SED2 [Cytospora mali]|uniref:tripeptidyl-peptidase II n=1 Tax=Cytospora mali TaxID=578113 RepID=A0A194UVH6_CYTMA|nr:Tripeptidyl-peptidase SED2 [Valsa mali var. pyri (nom. inval.)]
MKATGILLAAGLLASSAVGKPVKQRSAFAVKDAHHVPRTWTEVRRPDADHKIALRIGLKQGSFSELERQLYQVSDPDHRLYGQHLKAQDVHKLLEPADETFDLVHEWLSEYGIDKAQLDYTPARDWITVTLPVADVEDMLDTKYSIYRHEDGSELVRTPKWSLPLHLHEHIDTIQPTNSWFRAKPKAYALRVETLEDQKPALKLYTDPTVSDVCVWNSVTPTCLRTLYETIDYQTQSTDTNIVGLCDYLGESNNRNDTYKFLSEYRPEAKAGAYEFEFDSIANGTTSQIYTEEMIDDGTNVEGNLDVQTILGISWPTKLIAYTVGGSPPFTPDAATTTDSNEPYLVWLDSVLSESDDTLAKVISTSYDDDEQTVPISYATRVCNELAQLGARGVSLFYAAGDDGVGPSGYCVSNDGTNKSTLLPEFPSTCPYITSVGATMNFTPEVVAYTASGYAGGGGFSNYFSRPLYQDGIVDTYVDSLNGSYAGYYNQEGRGYPDLAAQGYHYTEVWDNSNVLVSGTSAATPTVSAIFALVNDALLAAGKSTVGFLNPWLYKQGYKAFTDITSGSAVGCSEIGDGLGFPAQKGWDAVTGFGTPKFKSILENLGVGNATFTGKRQGWSLEQKKRH